MSRDTPIYRLDTEELKEVYDFALSLGRNAGKILLDGVEKRCGEESGRRQGQEDKESAVDIVTQTDLGAWEGYPALGQSRLTLL
jgi:myo-inositol-1(or 4)-monophosphatase